MNNAIGYQGQRKDELEEINLCLKCTKVSCKSGECEKIKALRRMQKEKRAKK